MIVEKDRAGEGDSLSLIAHWATEDREALAVVTLGAFELPGRAELVRRITTSYVPRRHLQGTVEALRDLADAVSIACGSRLTERDAALADKADAARRLVGEGTE